MDEHGMTSVMRETLQEGLSRFYNRPVPVRELRREFFSGSSSFWAERLRVQLDGGECLEVFFKDLNPRHHLNSAPAVRAGGLGPSRRELLMYQGVLSPQRFGTPQLYAARWDPPGGVFWLFLEDAGGALLAGSADFSLWLAAARWAAGFHAATRRLPAGLGGVLSPPPPTHHPDVVGGARSEQPRP